MSSGLTSIQRMVVGHLDSLEPAFGPKADVTIVEELCRGTSIAAIAKQIGCTADDVVSRWQQILFPAITTDHGALTIDGRRDLIIAVRAREQQSMQPSQEASL